jgi:hypothetical protein
MQAASRGLVPEDGRFGGSTVMVSFRPERRWRRTQPVVGLPLRTEQANMRRRCAWRSAN